MRICFLITGLDHGGAENQLVRLARAWRARGAQVSVVVMIAPRAFTQELREAGIRVYELGMRRGVPDIRAVYRMWQVLVRERPDVLHGHMIHANLLARVMRGLGRARLVVCTAHSIDEGGRAREIAYRLTDRWSDMTTQVSVAGLQRYVAVGAVPRDKIRFVPNGVDLDRFCFDQEKRVRLRRELECGEDFIWLAVGSFTEPKDYPTMLHAFREVHEANGRSRLLIAGQGPQQAAIQEVTRALSIDRAVTFMGLRRDVADIMSASDGFVMSSAWEGMPMVLLEASACGLPIVATRVGGNSEVVIDTVSGFLVPRKNASQLAAAMSRMMDLTPAERRSMGAVAREHVVSHYSLTAVVDQWHDLYRELLEASLTKATRK